MSIAELQLRLHETIDSITDSDKLEAIYILLKGENAPYDRMTPEKYVAEIEEARQQVKDGKYLSVDDLEKESEGW